MSSRDLTLYEKKSKKKTGFSQGFLVANQKRLEIISLEDLSEGNFITPVSPLKFEDTAAVPLVSLRPAGDDLVKVWVGS